MLLVVEYQTPSNLRRFQHFVQIEKYVQTKDLQLSLSRSLSKSGSFKEQLKGEVRKITDAIYADRKHTDYLTHPLIKRELHI
jgi:hypothetical protein